MPQDVKIWKIIKGRTLEEIKKSRLKFEEQIEDWLEEDISMISPDLMVIGRQVETDFGGVIDLLCIDSTGDLVLIELKRDKTPRDVTAQVLDYAAWVKDLSNDKIQEIANSYLGDRGPLEKAFKERFGEELPEILNEHHKMLIVASQIDSSTERIVEYLSDTYGVNINAITFHYFEDSEGNEFLARVFLIEPEQVEYRTRTRTTSKRKPNLTFKELEELADSRGVGELYRKLVDGLSSVFEIKRTTRSAITFIGTINGSQLTLFSIIPGESQSPRIFPGKSEIEQGLRFQAYIDRLAKYFSVSKEEIIRILPPNLQEFVAWRGGPKTLAGYIQSFEEVERIVQGFKTFRNRDASSTKPNE